MNHKEVRNWFFPQYDDDGRLPVEPIRYTHLVKKGENTFKTFLSFLCKKDLEIIYNEIEKNHKGNDNKLLIIDNILK